MPVDEARLPPRTSMIDGLRFIARVAAPTWGKGILIRRRLMVKLAAALDLDARALREIQRLRRRYGAELVMISNPIRPQALVLSPIEARRILQEAPFPFSPASDEKAAALGHFEPDVSLLSEGASRQLRRELNETVLEPSRPLHCLASDMAMIVDEEFDRLSECTAAERALGWPAFSDAWFRIVRRVVLGDGARDDEAVTALLDSLRRRGNFAFALPKRRSAIGQLHRRLEEYLDAAPPSCLAGRIGHRSAEAAPTHQIAQWLFASGPAGISAFRTMAILAGAPEAAARVRAEFDRCDASTARAARPTPIPYTRASIVETIRLYPTTPMILRQARTDAMIAGMRLPAGAGLMIFAPFFHRDDQRLADAHQFRPERWLGIDPADHPDFLPFSAGPASCPARHVVSLLGALAVGYWLSRFDIALLEPRSLDPQSLPMTLDHFGLRLALEPLDRAAPDAVRSEAGARSFAPSQ